MNSQSADTIIISNRSYPAGQKKRWKKIKKYKPTSQSQSRKIISTKTLGLKGAIKELDGYIIPYPGEFKGLQQDQFKISLEAIANYVYSKVQYPKDMTCFFETFERTELTEPEDLEENATCTQVAI